MCDVLTSAQAHSFALPVALADGQSAWLNVSVDQAKGQTLLWGSTSSDQSCHIRNTMCANTLTRLGSCVLHHPGHACQSCSVLFRVVVPSISFLTCRLVEWIANSRSWTRTTHSQLWMASIGHSAPFRDVICLVCLFSYGVSAFDEDGRELVAQARLHAQNKVRY